FEEVVGVEFGKGDTLVVHARNPRTFFRRLGRLVIEEAFDVRRLETLDDSAQAVLGYLMGGRRQAGRDDPMSGPEKDPVPVSRPPALSGTAPPPSPLRAWPYLVWLSWQRQARARQMVWVALGLMALSVAFVAVNTAVGRWRSPRGVAPENRAVLVEL